MRRARKAGAAIVAVVLVLSASGCASASGSGPDRTQRGSTTRLSQAELEENAGLDLLTLIEQRRPRWLTPRAGVTFAGRSEVSIVLDGVPQTGSAELLRSIPCTEVRDVRYLSSSDATTQYGTNMVGGAIVVTLKR